MTKRQEIEKELSELTVPELAELVTVGSSILKKLQGNDGPFFSAMVGNELVVVFDGPMAGLMQQSISRLVEKYGGKQVEIKNQ